MADWYQARIAARREDGGDMVALELDVHGTPIDGSHVAAGQYVRLSLPPLGEGFFAVASAPKGDAGRLELLVKGGSPMSDRLKQLPVGETVLATAVLGKGFPVERARGRRVLLFATGSGISAVRSLVHALIAERPSFGRITLYFGARTPDAFAYLNELDSWRRQEIEVTQVVSRPGATGWQGLTGYVQQHVPNERLEDAVAFLCGQPEMVHGVETVLTGLGLPPERMFTNH